MRRTDASPRGKCPPAVVPTRVESEGESGRARAGLGFAVLLLHQTAAREGSKEALDTPPGVLQVPTLHWYRPKNEGLECCPCLPPLASLSSLYPRTWLPEPGSPIQEDMSLNL